MRLLLKVGGAQLEQRAARAELARSVRQARDAGHEIVLVHGGGNQIRELVRKLGLEERYHEGLRVTDAATADVVLMVLAGLVNKELVQTLADEGVRAAGLSGADGASFDVVPRRASDPSVDLGYVGDVVRVDGALVETLLDGGFLPVIATAAPLSRQRGPIDPAARDAAARDEAARAHFYNVNADLAAGPLARALECDALLFLTDVPGVLDGEKKRIECLTRERVHELRERGVISGGMIPKVEAALAALASTTDCLVKIAPAAGPDAVLRALESSTGTRFAREDQR